MITRRIIENLLYRSSNPEHLMKSLIAARVLNYNRMWRPKHHPELDLYCDKIKSPKILVVSYSTISVFIISSESVRKLYEVVEIYGNNTIFNSLSKSKIINTALDTVSVREFIPGFYNQIKYIPFDDPYEGQEGISGFKNSLKTEKYSNSDPDSDGFLETVDWESWYKDTLMNSELEMFLFSEVERNSWSIDTDLSSAVQTQVSTQSPRKILQAILSEL